MSEDLVLLARIRKPHGIKGELSLESFSFDDRRFLKLKKVLVRLPDGAVSEHAIRHVRISGQGVLLTFEGIEDRTSAEAFRGAELFIAESERPKLPKGRFYYDQIIGMTVIDDDTGVAIGRVKNVLDMPAGDVFVLDLEGREHLISNAGEEVRAIDVRKKELRVLLLKPYGE